MRKYFDYNPKADENPEFASIKPEPYICKIISVEDDEQKEFLKILFDIVEDSRGNIELKNYFTNLLNRSNNKDSWPYQGTIYRSYKKTAEQFFNSFIVAVEKSNAKTGYHWDWNPQSLVGKYMVILFREEEYQKNDGTIGISIKADSVRSISALKSGEIKFPLLVKKIDYSQKNNNQSNNANSFSIDVSEDDLPF